MIALGSRKKRDSHIATASTVKTLLHNTNSNVSTYLVSSRHAEIHARSRKFNGSFPCIALEHERLVESAGENDEHHEQVPSRSIGQRSRDVVQMRTTKQAWPRCSRRPKELPCVSLRTVPTPCRDIRNPDSFLLVAIVVDVRLRMNRFMMDLPSRRDSWRALHFDHFVST
jgi:hypothetical protein